jgi:hypothetical protein
MAMSHHGYSGPSVRDQEKDRMLYVNASDPVSILLRNLRIVIERRRRSLKLQQKIVQKARIGWLRLDAATH